MYIFHRASRTKWNKRSEDKIRLDVKALKKKNKMVAILKLPQA